MDERTINILKAEAGKLLRPVVEIEMKKMKKVLAQSVKKIEIYAKKNPEKTTLAAAVVGAALGATLAILLQADTDKKK